GFPPLNGAGGPAVHDHCFAPPRTTIGHCQMLVRPFVTALALATALPVAARAQMPGLPVLQNAFANPGLTAALNIGSGSGSSVYGAAASFGVGRLILSGGVGAFVPDSGSTAAAFGARAALPVFSFLNGAAGVAAFAGAGGVTQSGTSAVQIPIGAGVGWRRGIGATRGISVYAAPMFTFYRASGDGASTTKGLFRASVGLDFAVTRRLGVTLGAEGGAKPDDGDPGPSGSLAGIGVAWAFGRR
ncbi:MAG TPA: hypothetical protein VEA99_19970, partial [Gemmatimonadaceae bacterium]|nr:hypothetical protein [Gemmatimonadaceae bacterium]